MQHARTRWLARHPRTHARTHHARSRARSHAHAHAHTQTAHTRARARRRLAQCCRRSYGDAGIVRLYRGDVRAPYAGEAQEGSPVFQYSRVHVVPWHFGAAASLSYNYELTYATPVPHLHRDWAHRCHICTGAGLTPATSAPELGSPRPHPHRDWAQPGHIRTGTWAHPLAHPHRDWAHPLPHPRRDWAHPLPHPHRD
jgi:hypothetical protein